MSRVVQSRLLLRGLFLGEDETSADNDYSGSSYICFFNFLPYII